MVEYFWRCPEIFHDSRMKSINFRCGPDAKLEKMIRVIRITIGREKRGALGRKTAREGETGGRKKEGLSVVRDVLVLRHMERPRAAWPRGHYNASSSRVRDISNRSAFDSFKR